MTHWITLLRHGESEANKAEILQGQIDSPLSETGKLQARQVSQKWLDTGVQFDHLISSPLLRARQTAEIAAEVLGYQEDIEIDPVWMERSFGNLEGKSRSQIQQIVPPVDYFHPFEKIGGTGESQLDLYIRASQGLQQLIHRKSQRILVVSHGALIGKALFSILGITPQGHYHSPVFFLGNTSYINLRYVSDSRQWFVYGFNNPDEWSGLETR